MENYVKIKLLGEGSFGKVFLMREKKAGGRLVCVKQIYSIHHSSNASSSAPVVMEAQLMRKLSHPNLIRFLDAFPSSVAFDSSKQTKRKSCIVMEFCSGGDLRAYLQKHRDGGSGNSNDNGGPRHRLTEDLIWFWFLQLCLGLHHMHQLQILHRDIKTANIFLSNAGFLVLGDFGVARELSGTYEMASTVIGTPLYMAPETLEGKPYSFASDIWSLGCVLYEVCTGDPPFVAKSSPALVNKICEGRFAPLSRTKFSSRLQDLVSAMLRVDAAARPTAASILKYPAVHAHLKRYFHDRYTISSSSNITKAKQDEHAILTRQLQSLGVTISPAIDSTPEVVPGKEENLSVRGGGASFRSKSLDRGSNVEVKLAAEREYERRQQLLVALDQLQRLRLQEELEVKGADQRARKNESEQHGEVIAQESNRQPKSLVFPQFRSVPKDVEREICWRDPVQNRPKSSDRGRRQYQKRLETPRKTSLGDTSTSTSGVSSFLGIPRKGVPLTAQAKEFASRSPVCKDVRVLRKRESVKAAEKYKQGLEAIKPLKAPVVVKEPTVMQRARRCGPMTDEQMDDAILRSIEELQSALSVMR